MIDCLYPQSLVLSSHEYIRIGHGNSLIERATDDRKVTGYNPAATPGTLALSLTLLCQGLSEETLKANSMNVGTGLCHSSNLKSRYHSES